MIKILVFSLLIILNLSGCDTSGTPTHTPTYETAAPSPTNILKTKSATEIPPTAAHPTSPRNQMQHFASGQEFTVTAIRMLDANKGWAIGSLGRLVGDHVMLTADGGNTWKDVTPPEYVATPDVQKTASAFFQDAKTAWVIFSNLGSDTPQSVVWRTQDAGTSWQASHPLLVSNLTEFTNLGDLQFVSEEYGWLLMHIGMVMNHDYIVLYHTTDGGVTWSLLQDPYHDTSSIMPCSKNHILFTDATHGWLTGDCHGLSSEVLLLKSVDAGVTWEHVILPDPSSIPGLFSKQLAACGTYDIYFFSNNLGHISVTCAYYDQNPVNYTHFIYTTTDGGSTWTSAIYPGEALYFVSPNTGWAIAKKIQLTTDGGKTWKPISDVTWTAQFDFVNENNGWAIASADNEVALVKTDNGGARWSMLVPTVK